MKKIVLIDDSVFTLKRHQGIFAALGYGVHICTSLAQALDYLKANGADLVITDLLMPDQDGLEVLSTMKAQYPQIRTAVISADIQDARKQEVLELGAVDIVYKPLTEEKAKELLTKIGF